MQLIALAEVGFSPNIKTRIPSIMFWITVKSTLSRTALAKVNLIFRPLLTVTNFSM
jgi:hypothetical protein